MTTREGRIVIDVFPGGVALTDGRYATYNDLRADFLDLAHNAEQLPNVNDVVSLNHVRATFIEAARLMQVIGNLQPLGTPKHK